MNSNTMAFNLAKLKTHPACLYTQDLADICRPLQQLNISTFSHLRMTSPTTFAAISTNPEFMKNYVKREHYNADIHVDKNHCHLSDCLMWDNLTAKGQTAQMLQDAADFNFNHIFTIIQKTTTQTDFYHFGTHLKNPAINQMYINQYNALQKFIQYFNYSIQQSANLTSAYDIKLEIDSPNAVFDEADITLIQPDHTQKNQFLQSIQINNWHNIFTPRELDYIPLIVDGYTAKEIASMLSISPRTAEDYIFMLKKKLRVKNKAELIAKLLSHLSTRTA